jgi:hypothetical protein
MQGTAQWASSRMARPSFTASSARSRRPGNGVTSPQIAEVGGGIRSVHHRVSIRGSATSVPSTLAYRRPNYDPGAGSR